MKLSSQLKNATQTSVHAGQYVVVKTASGEQVAQGYVDTVDADRNVVTVRDVSSGTESVFEVDASKYNLWLRPEVIPQDDKPGPAAKGSSVVT